MKRSSTPSTTEEKKKLPKPKRNRHLKGSYYLAKIFDALLIADAKVVNPEFETAFNTYLEYLASAKSVPQEDIESAYALLQNVSPRWTVLATAYLRWVVHQIDTPPVKRTQFRSLPVDEDDIRLHAKPKSSVVVRIEINHETTSIKSRKYWIPAIGKFVEHNGRVFSKFLLEKNADDVWYTSYGKTPFYITGHWNGPQIIRFLLETGADVEVKHESGKNPLCKAALWNSEEIARSFMPT